MWVGRGIMKLNLQGSWWKDEKKGKGTDQHYLYKLRTHIVISITNKSYITFKLGETMSQT